MDNAILLKHHRASSTGSEISTARVDTFFYEPTNTESYAQRGSVLVLIQSTSNPDNEIDRAALNIEIFDEFTDAYFSTAEAGAPLSALEEALQTAITKGTERSQKMAEINISAVALWGTTLLYANPEGFVLCIRRNNEFYEISDYTYGVEEIKGDDLILLATPSYFQQVIMPIQLDDPDQSNSELFNSVQAHTVHPSEDDLADGYIVHVSMLTVPGEEEIIEIKLPEEIHQEARIKEHEPKTEKEEAPKASFFKSLVSRPSKSDPEIYLKTHSNKKRNRRLLVAALFLVLLGGSIAATRFMNKSDQIQQEQQQSIEEVEQALARANDIASLQQEEALTLIGTIQETLAEVKGAQTVNSEAITQYEAQTVELLDKIYRKKTVAKESRTPPTDILAQSFILGDKSVATESGITLNMDPEWQDTRAATTYFGNIYILDTTAGQVWRHIGDGTSYTSAQGYFESTLPLDQARDVAIDGNVYLLFSDSIQQYFRGQGTDFKLSGTYPQFNAVSLMATGADAKTIFVSTQEGILVFDKEGTYQEMLWFDEYQEPQEIITTDDGKELWIKDSSGWHIVNPEQA